jgi:DNA-directed RNA polymerase alpha subunit
MIGVYSGTETVDDHSAKLVLTKTISQGPPRMQHDFHECEEGPIGGLRLPPKAWHVLRRENITTIGRLRAVADKIERFQGVGSKTANAIRVELARMSASDEQPPDKALELQKLRLA